MKRSTDAPAGRLWLALVAVGVLTTAAAAAGAPVRATRGAQVTADEPQYLLTAISLAEDHDLDIADELTAQRWRPFHEAALPEQTKDLGGGRRVSPHDPLLPLLIAAPVALAGWVGAKLALSVVAGLTAALTAWVAVRRFGVPGRIALPVTAVLFLSAPLAVYGTQIYPEMVAALAVVGAVALLRGALRPVALASLAVAICALPWLAVKYAPVAAVLAALGLTALLRTGRPRAAALLCLALVAGGVAYVGLHLASYGGITPYAAGDHFVGGELTAVGSDPNYLGRARRLIGLVIDRHFGLAAWQPAWLLLPPALALTVRHRLEGWATVVAPLVAGWLTATFLALTMQGWWFPGRQVIVVLPLAVVVLAVAVQRSRVLLVAGAVLGLLGLASYAWLVADGVRGTINWVVTFTEVTDPWYRAWSALLPNYLDVSLGTWVRQTLWLAVLLGLSWRLDGSGLALLDRRGASARRPARGPARTARGGAVLVDGADAGPVVSRARDAGKADGGDDGRGGDTRGENRHQQTL